VCLQNKAKQFFNSVVIYLIEKNIKLLSQFLPLMTSSSTTTLSSQIKPIPRRHTVILESTRQLKRLQAKQIKIRTLKIPHIDIFYIYKVLGKVFVRPSSKYLKSLKTLRYLHCPRFWLTIVWIFSPLQNILAHLQGLSVGIYPRHSRIRTLRKFINRIRHLHRFEDFLRHEPNKNVPTLKLCPSRHVKSYIFSPNINLRSFPGIQKLVMHIPIVNIRVPKLPRSLEEISLIDQGPQSQVDISQRFCALVKQLNSLEDLKSIILVFPFKDYYQKAFSMLTVKNLEIKLVIDIGSLIETQSILSDIKNFIKRSGSKIILAPRNCSTEKYISLLYFLEKNFDEYQKSFYLEKLTFNFHSLYEIQNRVINYYSKMYSTINEIAFSYNINSLDWFNEWRIENWQKMLGLIYEHAGNMSSFKVVYNIIFVDAIHEATLSRIIEQAAELTRPSENKEKRDFIIEVNISSDLSTSCQGLVKFVGKLLKACGPVNILTCGLDNKAYMKYHDDVLDVLQENKNSGSLKRFVIKFGEAH